MLLGGDNGKILDSICVGTPDRTEVSGTLAREHFHFRHEPLN